MNNLPNGENLEYTPQPGNHLKGWIVALVAAGLLTTIILASGVYVAFAIIRSNIETTSLAIPIIAGDPTLNHIAFVGNDNNLWLVSPTGEKLRRLTTDGRGYRFPTWSPDSKRLAFIGPDETGNPVLYVSPTSWSAPQIVFQESASRPFYLYWAPDSNAITFLTQELSGMAMRLVDVQTPELNRIMGKGAPFYWVWSPESDKLLMHVGGAASTSNNAHISLLDNQEDAQRFELNSDPGRFQAPVWTSNGEHIFYVTEAENRSGAIFKTDVETLAEQKITDLQGFAFMVLSPNDEYVAYLQMDRGTRPPFGRPFLVKADGSNKKLLTESLVASMYWSPDGQKLALLSISRANEGPSAKKIQGLARPLGQDIQLRWWIYDVAADTIEPLASFAPTTAFLQTIPYFDQYHLSLTFWSPDSRYFVVTRRESDETGDGSVWVYDTTAQEEARQVGEGRLAVWSWQ